MSAIKNMSVLLTTDKEAISTKSIKIKVSFHVDS